MLAAEFLLLTDTRIVETASHTQPACVASARAVHAGLQVLLQAPCPEPHWSHLSPTESPPSHKPV